MPSPALRSLFALSLCTLLLAGCGKKDDKKTAAAPALTTDEQKVSYGIGYNMGKGASQQKSFPIDQAALKAGLEDGLAQAQLRLPEAELDKAFQALQQRVQAAAMAEAQKNVEAGNAFLAKNKTRPGVKTTASGLQYEILKSGKGGAKPKATSTVVVAYHGTLIDGTVFDSSVERGDAVTLPVNQFVPGWIEALQLMSVGDKWKLYVPANLGYGPQGRGKITPGSTLIFEMELKEIK